MKWSVTFGKIAGTRIVMHWTFLLLIAWIVITELNKGSDTSTILLTIAYVLCIFVCVILHEFGHALTAKKFGIKTPKVTLLPIGGMASLERMPEKPNKELLVAIAGPAVNVAIAAILIVLGSFSGLMSFDNLFSEESLKTLTTITTDNFLYALCIINIFLVLFNAIPAFPMDGGRVLRALLSYRLKRKKATDIAAKLGQVLGLVFILLGFFGNLVLILIGVFVIIGARSENTMIQQQVVLKGHKLKEAMKTRFTALQHNDTIQKAIDKLLEGSENHFIIEKSDKLAGILTKDKLTKAIIEHEKRDIPVINFTEESHTFESSESLNDVFLKLNRKKQPIYPVMEDDQVVGVIDMENLQEFVIVTGN